MLTVSILDSPVVFVFDINIAIVVVVVLLFHLILYIYIYIYIKRKGDNQPKELKGFLVARRMKYYIRCQAESLLMGNIFESLGRFGVIKRKVIWAP